MKPQPRNLGRKSRGWPIALMWLKGNKKEKGIEILIIMRRTMDILWCLKMPNELNCFAQYQLSIYPTMLIDLTYYEIHYNLVIYN